MSYKEFVRWCNNRACDGCWGFDAVLICAQIIGKINSYPFWKREKEWKKVSDEIVNEIVIPINRKIEDMKTRE